MELGLIAGLFLYLAVSYGMLSRLTHQNVEPDAVETGTTNEALDSHDNNSINNIGKLHFLDDKTEYLGCGYDMFKPWNNEKDATHLDNFKSPLLDSYLFGDIKTGDAAGRMDKLNIWILPIFNCRVYVENKIINSKKDYNMLLHEIYRKDWQRFAKVDVEINDDYTKWDEAMQRLRNSKIQNIQCSVYTAGISDVNDSTNMKQMLETMEKNINNCGDEFKLAGCTVQVYLRDPYATECLQCVSGWMNFLADYGTHFTSKITMGGSIKRFSYTNNANYHKDYKQNRKHITQTMFLGSIRGVEHGKVFNEEDKHDDKPESYDEYDTSFGPPITPGSITTNTIKKWVNQVVQNPVPIETEYTAIRDILKDDKHRKMFDAAVLYYGMTQGYNATQKFNVGYTDNVLFKLIQQSEEIVVNGVEERNKLCGGNKKVLWGFGVTFNKDGRLLQVKPCINGLNNCMLENGREVTSSFVWALCHNLITLQSKQVLVKGRADTAHSTVARCPQLMTVATGVVMRFAADKTEHIRACKPGLSACSYDNLGDNGFIYLVCVPARTFGVKQMRSYSTAKAHSSTVSCRERGYKIAKGLHIATKKTKDTINIKAELCPKYSPACGKPCGDCVSSLSWIICVK